MSHQYDALNERVVFLPRALLGDSGALCHGFSPNQGKVYDLFNQERAFDSRRNLETDPSKKQAIPYVVVLSELGVLRLFRKSSQTEARLHGKISIGVGGHIPDDLQDSEDILAAGMLRELHEELHLIGEHDVPIFRGTLNDDSNEVGQVHLGIVFTVRVKADRVSVRETEKMSGEWISIEELHKNADRMETWSALLLPHLESWM